MTDADALLRSGDLAGARRALVEAARTAPGDAKTRLFLFQLLALAGEWDKAATQLTTLASLSPEAQMLSVVYGQAIAAERVRADVFAGTVRADIHGEAPDWSLQIAEALQLSTQGRVDEADALRDTAFAAAPDTPGSFNDTPIAWIADADSRVGPMIEAIIGGRYGLLPFSDIAVMVSEGPRDLRDLVWYPVELTLKTGPRIAALLPTRYPIIGDPAALDADHALARATDWRDDGQGGEIGVGQRLLMTSDGGEHGLLSLRQLRFD
ncbi:type VI secretion system accessory protein TagJ [Sphingomonas pseudosanguinis]|uniref:Type VI secretion system protein ImpE n=1 Tax=Sphingomonas pseudosanguinis TaxID=413712 RepID=A0A7W6AHW1_9SPHN|nr:type VI secretion system accessory protein TagJ [Sphingomonas pseudosanguinis]MBB3880826.1 type VI secretion system protein ImpE [Sphingomonas pseudosanguinis]MBN3535385.1 tetratricopeptide repeat protein [Sphingomonas pseudosanguinis]